MFKTAYNMKKDLPKYSAIGHGGRLRLPRKTLMQTKRNSGKNPGAGKALFGLTLGCDNTELNQGGDRRERDLGSLL